MESIVRRIGPLNFEQRHRGRPEEAFGSLVRTIVGQQISTKAARSVFDRLAVSFGGRPPTPDEILAASDEELLACGLSRQKVTYLRDLAQRIVSGGLDLGALHELPDKEIVAEIVAVKGLGAWSSDMFLIFHLRRPNVLPVGDLGVRRAAERAYDLPDLPDSKTLHRLAEPWRPHRTLASFYLWESLGAAPVTDEASG